MEADWADEANKLLPRVYTNAKNQSFGEYFPWSSPNAFTQQWLDFLLDRSTANPLKRTLAEHPKISETCFQQLERLVTPPAAMCERILRLKNELHLDEGLLQLSSLAITFSGILSSSDAAKEMPVPGMKPEDLELERLDLEEQQEDVDRSSYLLSECISDSSETLNFTTNGAEESDFGHPLRLLNRKSRKGKDGNPKKEYFRAQLIRALKKSIRQLATGKFPKAAIHRVNPNNLSQVQCYESLKHFYIQHRRELDKVSSTAKGPATDGKTKRRGKAAKNCLLSYSDSFCKGFFSSETIRRYNTLFCALVYSAPPSEMCKKMKAKCCAEEEHTSQCDTVWERVYQYACVGMLQELGLKVPE